MSQKLAKFNFEWVENILQFSEVFIKNYMKKVKKVIFLRFNTPKNYMNFIVTCHFYQQERNLEKLKSL